MSSHEHLSLDLLADLLSGEATDLPVRQHLARHLAETCPTCGSHLHEIQRLQEEMDHWSESISVREGRKAPRLLEGLLALSQDERVERVLTHPEHQTWGLCQILLQRSRGEAGCEPERSGELAELATLIAGELPGEAYHPEWLQDLKARSWAYLGNARRISGELRSAASALRTAERHLREGSTGRPEVRAEILDLKASLLRTQGRFEAARTLLSEALNLSFDSGNLQDVSHLLINLAKTWEEEGSVETAIADLHRAEEYAHLARDPRLPYQLQHNLLCCLTLDDRFEAARDLLPTVRELAQEAGTEIDRQRLQWVEGRIALGLGDLEAAEHILLRVRDSFLGKGFSLDVALVSLDLALVYAHQERTDDLRDLASDLVSFCQLREIHREALAAVRLLQEALRLEILSLELVQELGRFLHLGRSGLGPT